MNRYRLFLLLLCFTALQPCAQQLKEEDFARYTTAGGMSDNAVTGLAQDARGYIWVATNAGLNRFNGSRFIQFHSTDDSLSLPAEELTGLSWLDDHRLAVYSGAGLHIVDVKTGATRNLIIPFHRHQYLYKFNTIHGAKTDDKGNIFVLSRSGFYHFHNDSLVWRFDYYSEKELDITHFHFGGELFDYDGRHLLIVSIAGFYLYDKEKRTLKKIGDDHSLLSAFLYPSHTYYRFLQFGQGRFFVLRQDSDSLFYVNTVENKKVLSRLPFKASLMEFHYRSRLVAESDSVFYITGQNAGFYKMQFSPATGMAKLNPEKYFSAFRCTDLLIDDEAQLWIGTNKGLYRHDAQKAAVRFAVLPSGLTDSFPNLRLMNAYTAGTQLYAGARGEAGLLLFDRETMRYEKQIFFDKKIEGNNQVTALAPVNASHLLLGTYDVLQLLNLQNKKLQPLIPRGWTAGGDWTNDLLTDRQGTIWVSAGSNVYNYFPRNNSFALVPLPAGQMNRPLFLAEDKDGNIWMASHGLARYNSRRQNFDLVVDSFPFIKVPDRQVAALLFDNHNTLWFGSNNNGLIRYDVRSRTFRHFTTRNGLPDNNVLALLSIGNKLWIACVSGVACLDLNTLEVSSFGREDGFPDMPIAKGARFFYDTVTQQIYLPYTTAIARFYPSQILYKRAAPGLFIENLSVTGKGSFFLPGENFTTPWNRNDITVTIGSIGFSGVQSRRYAYRMADEEGTPWISLGNQPTFSVSALSPGTHRIQVKVFSATNRWPAQVKELRLSVLPPLWLKPWFLIIVGLVVSGLFYLFIRWRIALVRRKEMVNTQIEKLKAENYKSQFELEQVTHYFSSSLAGKKTEDEVLWDVAANLIGRMNYEDCIIYCWNRSKAKMVQKAGWGPKGKPEIIKADGFEVAPGQGIVGHVIQTKKPVLVNDTRVDERYRVDDSFRLSELAVPIIHSNELLGVIDSENSKANYFTERDIKILTTIATLIGNKLKQLQSEQRLEAKKRELAGINEQLAEARLSALQAQMNPHFVFNALNSIKRMILDSDNERASRYLSKFALMIRMTLEHSKETFVTLHENIQYLKAYLDMEKLRFDDTFTYDIHADENVDTTETVLPSMMIQPLVENAIWHGLMYAEKDKRLSVSFNQKQNKITCTVEDNGIGIRQSEKLRQEHRPAHRSVGLENLRKRIKIMNEKYNTACSLQITDLKEAGINGSGTRVVLQFNLLNA